MLAFASAAAEAASLEETYLAARNRYIAKFKKLEVSAQAGDALSKQEKQALSDLKQQLGRIIGDIAIRGFSSQGKTNFDTLSTGDVGFGHVRTGRACASMWRRSCMAWAQGWILRQSSLDKGFGGRGSVSVAGVHGYRPVEGKEADSRERSAGFDDDIPF